MASKCIHELHECTHELHLLIEMLRFLKLLFQKSERDDQNETSSDRCLPQCEESKENIMDRNENSNDACLPQSEEPKENIKCEIVKER